MNPGALAEDAVSIRRLRAVGVSGHDVRRQLAAVPIPATRRFVFVRRVILRTRPDEIGRAMTTALARLAEDSRMETLAFADFPAVVVACARAASTGGLGGGVGGGWHWRALGLSRNAGLGESVGALLRAYPLEAAAATVALAANRLLAPVWRDLSEFAAAQLTAALGEAAGFSPPNWPDEADFRTVVDAGLEADFEPVLARAAAFWGPMLRGLPRRHEAVRTAATLSLMRWSPMSLQAPSGPLWPHLLARLADPMDLRARIAPTTAEPLPAPEAAREAPLVDGRPPSASGARERPVRLESMAPPREPGSDRRPGSSTSASSTSAPSAPIASTPTADAFVRDAAPLAESLPHGEFVSTGWGGVLFLINALNRLDIAARLTALGPAAPSGWRVLVDLGLALGMPNDEPLAEFLGAQDLAPPPPPGFCEQALTDMQALYAPDEAWPPPLQEPARLLANETHLDLDLMTRRVNIMIRRVGLDVDPGWVPWLGRIVAFHYPNVSATHMGGA
ncbi:MAG: hypothetical protein JO223_21340 [Hyphomicrobiales bacterium]|nr:hypothetical protein [Hyphomicrobiales bacterium]